MKAMIFAAGLGSRLKPLTDNIPKALAVVAGKTLLERAVLHLASQGVTYIVINIHHHAEQIIQFIKSHRNFGLDIYFSDESDELLDTGGGLLKAEKHFIGTEPFVIMNADVISNINLNKMLDFHRQNDALITLAMRNRTESSRQLLFDIDGLLCGKVDRSKGIKILYSSDENIKELAFSGIHIVSPKWFELNKVSGKFSIIESYLELCQNNKIISYVHNEDYWFDVGSIEKLTEAENFFKKMEI
jgi:NDP-sugar pyrophosphorylase family protein